MSLTTALLAASLAATTGGSTMFFPVVVHEQYGAARSGHTAVTYETKSVPRGSTVTVVAYRTGEKGTRVLLLLSGVQANRTFGAHVHKKACGPDPADAGPHYQNRPDPVQPSTDPEYANARNEVWLDLTTDQRGNGWSTAWVNWRFRDNQARSVVVHQHATSKHHGHAGDAGPRLGCVNVPFAQTSQGS